jgi:hypothetical protein
MPSAKRAAKVKGPWQATKIVSRPLASLVPSATNSRRHPPEQIEQLRASLRQFGFPKPILISAKLEIIAGHGITEAALAEGWTHGPTITAEGWTSEQIRAFRLFDNWSATRSEWIPDMVESEIAQLGALNFDLEPLGLNTIELPDLDNVEAAPAPPRANRSKTTIFLSVKNADAEKARKTVAAALTKAKIEHNL